MSNAVTTIENSNPLVDKSDSQRDELTHLRIVNRLIGKSLLKERLKGRIYVPLENLNNSEVNKLHLDENDWITSGVIHRRSEMHTRSGKLLSYIQITDLKDCYVTIFLNGNIAQYPSIPVGELIYVLNASFIYSKDSTNKISLSIHKSNQIQHIGKAKDYGICRGITRSGIKCKNAVNKEISSYCMYHIRKTQEDVNTMRGDINSGNLYISLLTIECLTKNYLSNNLSDGRFQIGKEIIDCRNQEQKKRIDLSKLTGLKGYKTQVIDGVRVGGYVASRLLEKKNEEEKKHGLEHAISNVSQKRSISTLTPLLGRDALPDGTITLDESEFEKKRLAKLHQVKGQLDQIKINQKTTPNSKLQQLQQLQKLQKLQKLQTKVQATGNSVFDSILHSTSSNLKNAKQEAMAYKNVYAEKELQDKARIAHERQALLDRKEEEKLKLMNIKVNCFWCFNCNKFVENGIARDYCESHGHYLERRCEMKRMFECLQCHNRKSFIGTKNPTERCACGGVLWVPCTLFKEKTVKTEKLIITPKSVNLLYNHDIVSHDYNCLLNYSFIT